MNIRSYTHKKMLGLIFYKTAAVSESIKRYKLSEELYSLSRKQGFREYSSVMKQYQLSSHTKDEWQQNAILDDYLSEHIDERLAHKLAKNYISLERYNDALRVLSNYKDTSSLDLSATAYVKKGDLISYTKIIETLLDRQKSIHRYNQIFFAYARTGNFKKLTPLLQSSLKKTKFSKEQKDKFIHATLEGLSRSFYFNELISLYSQINTLYDSPYFTIKTAMAYEIIGDKKKALEIYGSLGELDNEFYWWSTIRSAGIYNHLNQHEKAYNLLSKLLTIDNEIPRRKGLPIFSLAIKAYNFAKNNNYSLAVSLLFDIFPGWNIRTWNDNDSVIFKEYTCNTVHLFSQKSIKIDNYLQSLKAYSLRLAEKNLWETGTKALNLTIVSFERKNKKLPEDIYTQLARCQAQSNLYAESLQTIKKGLSLYPSSFALRVEKAQLYTKQSNVYEANRIWESIFLRFDYRQFAPNIFTSAAEAALMTLKFDTHEEILQKAEITHGRYNRTISYYIWHSLCTKISNLNTELSITGGLSFSSVYTKENLHTRFNSYSEIIQKYTYNEEMAHRVNHRNIQTQSLLMIEVWASKDNRKIKQTLTKLKPSLNLSDNPLTAIIFKLILSSRTEHEKILKEAKKALVSTKAEKLSYHEWLIIYQLLISNKFLALGYIAREKAITNAVHSQVNGARSSHYHLQKIFHAALELENLKQAGDILTYIESYFPEQSINKDLVRLFNIFNNEISYSPQNNDPYNKLISKKSVAIVGPAPSNLYHGQEIDAHDTVIRFNYRGLLDTSESGKYGTKVSIAYQNGPNIRTYFINSIPKYMKKINLYNVEFTLNKHVENALVNGNARKNKNRVKLFNGTMMAVPTAVLDILPFSPKKITLYGTNFYLSKNQYKASYTRHKDGVDKYTDKKQTVHRLLDLVGIHDLISQRRFINNLVKYRKIEVAPECMEVLSLSDSEYMERMEELYSYY